MRPRKLIDPFRRMILRAGPLLAFAFPAVIGSENVSDSTLVIGTKRPPRVAFPPSPVPRIPDFSFIDTMPIPPEDEQVYATNPVEIAPNVRWEKARYLREVIRYLINSDPGGTPHSFEEISDWLKGQGFAFYRLKKLQAMAAKALIANEIFIVLLMSKRNREHMPARVNFGGQAGVITTAGPGMPYFTVIRGFREIDNPIHKNRNPKENKTNVFYTFTDDVVFAVNDQYFNRDLEMGRFSFTGKMVAFPFDLGDQAWIKDVFVLLPVNIPKARLSKFLEATMENVELKYRTPEVVLP